MCKAHGAAPPIFEQRQEFLIVTFPAEMAGARSAPGRHQVGTKSGSEAGQVTAQVTAQVSAQVTAQVAAFCREPQPAKAIMAKLGLKHWKTFQTNYLAPLMAMGLLERTIPDKPRSRMQRYRTTEAGVVVMKDKTTDQGPRRGGHGHA